MELQEWTLHHIRFKDAMRKKIQHIESTEEKIIVEEKTQKKIYYVNTDIQPALQQAEQESERPVFVVTENTTQNVNALLSQWPTLAKQNQFTILFVNVKENNYWHVNPKTHEFITDKDNVKESITKLHQTVTHA